MPSWRYQGRPRSNSYEAGLRGHNYQPGKHLASWLVSVRYL